MCGRDKRGVRPPRLHTGSSSWRTSTLLVPAQNVFACHRAWPLSTLFRDTLSIVPPRPPPAATLSSRIPTLLSYLSLPPASRACRPLSSSLWRTLLASPRTRRAPPRAPRRTAPFRAVANTCVCVVLIVLHESHRIVAVLLRARWDGQHPTGFEGRPLPHPEHPDLRNSQQRRRLHNPRA